MPIVYGKDANWPPMCGRESRSDGKVAAGGRGAGMRGTFSVAIWGGGAGKLQGSQLETA